MLHLKMSHCRPMTTQLRRQAGEQNHTPLVDLVVPHILKARNLLHCNRSECRTDRQVMPTRPLHTPWSIWSLLTYTRSRTCLMRSGCLAYRKPKKRACGEQEDALIGNAVKQTCLSTRQVLAYRKLTRQQGAGGML